jgi:HlyD family secretion protein
MSSREKAVLDGGRDGFSIGGRVVTGTLFMLLLVVGCGGWAATAQLTGAVIATGSVTVDQNLKAVQHRDGGIVGEISVREGDRVGKGQVLLRLDDAQTRAELSIVRSQITELSIRRARLLAERDMLEAIEFPDLPSDDARSALTLGETRLFEGNRAARLSQKEQLSLGIEQLREEIRGLEAQRESKLLELSLVEDEHAKIKGLAEKRLIEANRVYQTDREIARLRGEGGEVEASIARVKARASEIQLQILAIDNAARTEAQRELSIAEPKLAELEERRIAIEDRLSRTELRAPIGGTVNEVSVHTVGGIITPAETLVTIVPADAPLKISARIMPTDIDQVREGHEARVRFPAFNQQRTPELFGTVSYVSPATSTDRATGQTFYLANIELAAGEVEKLGEQALMPGMPVEVYVTTEERTALSYFAKPVADQISRAFKEQ